MGTVKHPWICTVSNRIVNPLLPDAVDIDIEDISYALSNLCRFTGHCPFYTVAQHSVLVSYMVDPRYEKEALLHDAAEAYINDLNSPVKTLIKGDYKRMENELEMCIAGKFGLVTPQPAEVKAADFEAFKLEVMRLYSRVSPLWKEYITDPMMYATAKHKPIRLWGPAEAHQIFMGRYSELFEMPTMGTAWQELKDSEE